MFERMPKWHFASKVMIALKRNRHFNIFSIPKHDGKVIQVIQTCSCPLFGNPMKRDSQSAAGTTTKALSKAK
jgi:hypothetical protein